jgi:regulatory protein
VKPAAPRSLKARALQWLAQREHSRAEMQRKLLPHARALAAQGVAEGGDAGDAIDPMARVIEVLDWLESNRYLSQQRFVESRIHVRAARHGNLRIHQELAQHGIALDADAAQSLKASEIDRAREVWSRKFDGPATDAAGRARQARFLTGRGFSAETVRRLLRESARGLPSDETD